MSTQQVTVPLQEVAGFTFNLGSIVAIDRTGYKPEATEPDEKQESIITLHLVYDVAHDFIGERADAFNLWFLQATGQAHIQPANGMLPFKR